MSYFKSQSQLDKYVKDRKFPEKSIYYGKTVEQANIIKDNPELIKLDEDKQKLIEAQSLLPEHLQDGLQSQINELDNKVSSIYEDIEKKTPELEITSNEILNLIEQNDFYSLTEIFNNEILSKETCKDLMEKTLNENGFLPALIPQKNLPKEGFDIILSKMDEENQHNGTKASNAKDLIKYHSRDFNQEQWNKINSLSSLRSYAIKYGCLPDDIKNQIFDKDNSISEFNYYSKLRDFARNPNLTKEDWSRLEESDNSSNKTLKQELAFRNDISEEKALQYFQDDKVRFALSQNENCPKKILKQLHQLKGQENKEIRKYAKRSLARHIASDPKSSDKEILSLLQNRKVDRKVLDKIKQRENNSEEVQRIVSLFR